MTTRLANPAELERTAKRLENGAAQLEHLRKALLQSARQPDWEGTAGDSMRTDIDGFAKEIATAERELRNMAHDLRVGANRVRDERDDRQHYHPAKRDDSHFVAQRQTVLVAERLEPIGQGFEPSTHEHTQLIAEHLPLGLDPKQAEHIAEQIAAQDPAGATR
jgi:uncharacterized protein YukE